MASYDAQHSAEVVPIPLDVCATGCGRLSAISCPWEADTCSECSMMRAVAGLSDTIASCPAHGDYLESED